MSGMNHSGTRDRDTIERELRTLAGVRDAHRERGVIMPSTDQMDALLDELIELGSAGRHRKYEGSDARPSLWR